VTVFAFNPCSCTLCWLQLIKDGTAGIYIVVTKPLKSYTPDTRLRLVKALVIQWEPVELSLIYGRILDCCIYMTSFIHQYRCYIQRLFDNQLDLDSDCAPQAPPTQVLELVAGLMLVYFILVCLKCFM
jgi:hypothetical protein